MYNLIVSFFQKINYLLTYLQKFVQICLFFQPYFLIQKIRPKVAATELFLLCDVLMRMSSKLSDKFRLKIAKLSKVLSS